MELAAEEPGDALNLISCTRPRMCADRLVLSGLAH